MKSKRLFPARFVAVFAAGLSLLSAEWLRAELRVGVAKVDITPPLPVAVSGQMRTRIAKTVESPVMAAIVALEKVDGEGKPVDQAVMVSCDLVAIRDGIIEKVRADLKKRDLPGLDPRKVFLSATHTHTAPVMQDGKYRIPEGVTQPAEFVAFLVEKVGGAIEEAWTGREPGAVNWGLGHAVVARNRRIVYHGGESKMYGSTAAAKFKGIEGYEDHGVEVLFFWSGDEEQPAAMAVNVACPAQEVESRSAVNSDYWHPVREALAKKYGEDLVVLTWIGAAGDQSPHLMFRKAAEQRMMKVRGLTALEEISRRIVRAVDDAWEVAKNTERHEDPPLSHQVAELDLPKRMVTEAEYKDAQAQVEIHRKAAEEKGADSLWRWLWNQKTVDRYEAQESDRVLPMEMHAIRLGDIAICTNRFELYTEYGIRMKSRSKALQTFVVQLTGPGTYLATGEAEAGGGYSAIINSCQVGPKGGDFLVEETVKALNAMWDE